eukprot:TRINITY_DN76406_c0_g1_i1.p1 TRINITY_DN76406_c0_g1~~TRINITY_DN76406_c0_g1_i1.p1  ORF type:complete len:879 (+),score=261.18 TRINITY_DN76406_c0_g1_i1:28-2664(+)
MGVALSLRPVPGRLLSALLAAASLARQGDAALNVEQAVEEAILRLRERVFVADALVRKPADSKCSSAVDGPHCSSQVSAAATSSSSRPPQENAGAPALLTDGIFSSRLFSSSDGGEMLDAYVLGAGLKEAARLQRQQASQEEVPHRDRSAAHTFRGGRGRSALLSFRAVEPWRKSFPFDFAGSSRLGGGIPFRVRWEGPWHLAESPLHDNYVVKRGRFVAQLRGAVGGLRFGRPVHLQAMDVSRPPRHDCLGHGAAGRPPTSLIVKGRRSGQDVFQEVVPNWEMQHFVNGVAFFALTETEAVDEVVFLMAECLLLGAVQVTFNAGHQGGAAAPEAQVASGDLPLYLTLREGWHAVGWEEVEFRMPTAIGDVPAWSLNEVARQRLSLRPGLFELPQEQAGQAEEPGLADASVVEALDREEEEELMRGWKERKDSGDLQQVSDESSYTGPEPIAMPPGLEEVTLDATNMVQDSMPTLIAHQRNASTLMALVRDLHMHGDTTDASHDTFRAELLRGLSSEAVIADLVQLATTLTEAAEDVMPSMTAVAQTASEVTDVLWRTLKLDFLDTVLLRWKNAIQDAPAEARYGAAANQDEELLQLKGIENQLDRLQEHLGDDPAAEEKIRDLRKQLEQLHMQLSDISAVQERLPDLQMQLQLELQDLKGSQKMNTAIQEQLQEQLQEQFSGDPATLEQFQEQLQEHLQEQFGDDSAALEQIQELQGQLEAQLTGEPVLQEQLEEGALEESQLDAYMPGATLMEKLARTIERAEGVLRIRMRHKKPPVLSAKLPADLFGFEGSSQFEISIQTLQQTDGSPSEELQITIRDAQGNEYGTQQASMQSLGLAGMGGAKDLLQALTAGGMMAYDVDVDGTPPAQGEGEESL